MIAALGVRYAANVATCRKVVCEVGRLFRHAHASGVVLLDELTDELLLEFCWSALKNRDGVVGVSARTAANRQAFVRAALDELTRVGLWTRVTRFESIGRDTRSGSRPLTVDELRRVEVHATDGIFTGRRAVLVAIPFS